MDKVLIEIVEIIQTSEEKVSTKTGKPYRMAKIKDGKSGRIGTSFGAWTKDWKLGDTFEGVWKENEYNGQVQWNIENPNQQARGGGNFGGAPAAAAQSSEVVAYQIAATLAPLFFDKKKTKITKITDLAKAVLVEMESMKPAPAPAPTPAPAAPAAEVAPAAETTAEVEDDDDDDDELF